MERDGWILTQRKGVGRIYEAGDNLVGLLADFVEHPFHTDVVDLGPVDAGAAPDDLKPRTLFGSRFGEPP